MRKDAAECDAAGYTFIARINWEMADFLDPYKDPEELNNDAT